MLSGPLHEYYGKGISELSQPSIFFVSFFTSKYFDRCSANWVIYLCNYQSCIKIVLTCNWILSVLMDIPWIFVRYNHLVSFIAIVFFHTIRQSSLKCPVTIQLASLAWDYYHHHLSLPFDFALKISSFVLGIKYAFFPEWMFQIMIFTSQLSNYYCITPLICCILIQIKNLWIPHGLHVKRCQEKEIWGLMLWGDVTYATIFWICGSVIKRLSVAEASTLTFLRLLFECLLSFHH